MARPSMPALYHRIHDALLREGVAKTDSEAWRRAVAAVARGCLTGQTGIPGVELEGTTRAQYCAAYKKWKKDHPKGTGLGKNPNGRG